MPSSSLIIDLPLVTVRALAVRQIVSTASRASSAVAHQCTLAAGGEHVGFPFLQVEVEMRQRVVLDVACDVAKLLELRQRGDGGGAARDEAGAAARQCPLQPHVGQRAMGVLLEGGGGGDVHAGPVAAVQWLLRDRSLATVGRPAGFISGTWSQKEIASFNFRARPDEFANLVGLSRG